MSERRELPYDWKDLKRRLQGRILALLPALGIHEAVRGGMVTPLNPRRTDRKPGSFVIWTSPADGAGAWKDYACGEDCKGDVFDLIQYLQGLREKIDAYWWAMDFLGLGRGEIRTAPQAALDRQRAEQERAAAAARADSVAETKAHQLFRRWLELPRLTGTLAETYLREARMIPLERLDHIPGCLRFAAALEHVDEDTGEITVWPAMVAAMTRGKQVTGLHRTWLAPDGSGKAPVAKPKKMIGSVRGAAMRLSPGPSGYSPTQATKKGVTGPLAVGEGIETSLTVACARPDYRVWAAGSLSLMGLVEWPQCASAAVLLRDNDWKPEARTAFDRAMASWARQAAGRPLEAAASAVGSDFNDMVRAG